MATGEMSPADSELFNSAIISLHSAPDLSLAKDGTEIIDEALSLQLNPDERLTQPF